MHFLKFLIIIVGLGLSTLRGTQEYTPPLTQEQILRLFILVQTNHQQNQNYFQDIKKREKEERENLKYTTDQQKKSERQRTKNKIYNKPGKYVGKYNSHIYYSKKGKN